MKNLVYFSGEIIKGKDIEEVKQNIANFYKTEKNKLEK